jgi:hypothetical protein
MGYDYYARQPSTPYPTGEYDHIIWSQWFDDPRNYLRRNMWGGARLAEAMVKLGMAYDVEQYIELPDWPEEWGCHWDDKDEDYVGPLADEYKKKLEEHLSWHGVSDIPGIPVHKIAGTNDSWHVTALECQAALGIYQQRIAAGEQHPESFRDDVIPFLEHCAKTDGFETR